MPKLISLALLFAMLTLTACETVPDAQWKSIPEANLEFDSAWIKVTNAVIGKDFDIATADGKSGYLRTAWKSMGGGGSLLSPSLRTRVHVRCEQHQPFKVLVKVERQRNSGQGWAAYGTDPTVESEIVDELEGRLKSR